MEQAIGIGIVCTEFHLAHTNILCSNQRNTFNPTKEKARRYWGYKERSISQGKAIY